MSMTTPRVTVPVDEQVIKRLQEEADHPGLGDSAMVFGPDLRALLRAYRSLSAAPAPEGGAAHYGDPCVKCGVGHDDVSPGPCRDDGITISRERANALLSYLKNGRGPAGWPTTLWCEVQAFIKNIEAALATREEAPDWTARTEAAWAENNREEAPAEAGEPKYFAAFMAGDGALRAQPPAREDAQPVAGVDVLFARAAAMRAMLDRLNVRNTNSLTDGQLAAEYQRLHAHPAPDALRVAVEALETINHIRSEMVGVPVDSEAANAWALALDAAADHARQALAALQAEQGAK